MKNTQYMIVTAGSYDKLVALVNEQIEKAASIRACGAPFWRPEDKQWYQGLFVVGIDA